MFIITSGRAHFGKRVSLKLSNRVKRRVETVGDLCFWQLKWRRKDKKDRGQSLLGVETQALRSTRKHAFISKVWINNFDHSSESLIEADQAPFHGWLDIASNCLHAYNSKVNCDLVRLVISSESSVSPQSVPGLDHTPNFETMSMKFRTQFKFESLIEFHLVRSGVELCVYWADVIRQRHYRKSID